MRAGEANDLGRSIAALLEAGQVAPACQRLTPILTQRTPFATLRRIGQPIGQAPLQQVNAFLDSIAAGQTIGGWVIIASALKGQLDRDLPGAFARCRSLIRTAGVWYAADILGEGLAGEALVQDFRPALAQLRAWQADDDPWVRRAVGVAVHFWAKRSRGAPELVPHTWALLGLLEPMFDEWELNAVKGVGWGLKTLGRYYPEQVAAWLVDDIVPGQRCHRALMLRKALTYLTEEQRDRVAGLGAAVSGA
jgi:3-methyladenine DNA glycosylase AlkD